MSFFANTLGGNPFSTPVGNRIEQATDATLASENWALNMEICDMVNETEEGPRDAVKAIRKRLVQNAGKNYTVVMYTLIVLETCVKNCGRRFHLLACSKDFIQELVKLIGPKNDPPTAVQEKVLSLIQSWADAFRNIPELSGVVSVYSDLRAKGIEFPPTDLDAMAPIHTPQRSVETTVSIPSTTTTIIDPQIPVVIHSSPIPIAIPTGVITPEQRSKLQSELDVVQSNMVVLGEMLSEMRPGHEQPDELELLQELNATCHGMQERLVELISKLSNDELTAELLRVNDDLNNLFLRYSRWEKNRGAGAQSASAVLAKAIGPSPKPPLQSDDSLIDLGPPDDLSDQLNKLGISDGSASAQLAKVGTVTARNGPQGDDEFDMFAQSRKATYESSKTGSPRSFSIEDQLIHAHDSIPTKVSTGTQLGAVPSLGSVTVSLPSTQSATHIADYDALYEDEIETDVQIESQGSVIKHLLGQVKIGMDLTKVVLPTFILERRSLLEMYADYFAHPDIFVRIADLKDPRDRMVQVVKWYMSSYHAGRKSSVAKKPYNPILGEVFYCLWDIPEDNEITTDEFAQDGPIPWCKRNQLSFVAEQVSHHPPISAFYAEHYNKKISFNAHIYTKSKFLGLSICVHNIGQGVVSVLEYNEDYVVTFPNGYGRSILTVPWIELGGPVTITCQKTGYHCNIEFITKPFYGNKKHKIFAEVFGPEDPKKPFLTVNGEWNGLMEAKWNDGDTEEFINVHTLNTVKKLVRPISQQTENESRKLWKEVTAGLKFNDIDLATNAKATLEQKQRDEAKYRKDGNISWETKLFSKTQEESWLYLKPLQQRLLDASNT